MVRKLQTSLIAAKTIPTIGKSKGALDGTTEEPMNPLWEEIHRFLALMHHELGDLGSFILIRIPKELMRHKKYKVQMT